MEPLARDSPARFAVWVITVSLLAVVLLWAAYAARAALLLIYVSSLLAVGLSPLVLKIERWPLRLARGRQVPRGLAILLIYIVVLGGLAATITMVLPSLIDQSRELWTALPGMFERVQQWLVERGLLRRAMTPQEAFERAPIGGSQAV